MATPSNLPSRKSSLVRASTLAALATASGANATIIYFNTPITSDNSTLGTVDWNIDGIGEIEVPIKNSYSSWYGFTKGLHPAGGEKYNTRLRFALDTGDKIVNLNANVAISASAPGLNFRGASFFYPGFYQPGSQFTSGATTYLGFKFTPGATPLYGWANVTYTAGGDLGTFTVNEWAYDDTGASILTGVSAVPEPSTYALGLGALALGAAGLRRRRRASATAI